MKWSRLKRLVSPEVAVPPAVVLDAEGVTACFGRGASSRILWSQIESVEIGIVLATDLGYSEAFWRLAGEGAEFVAPVEMIMNADQLSDMLFKLPGFDMETYRRAREAESQGAPGEFVCWHRKGDA